MQVNPMQMMAAHAEVTAQLEMMSQRAQQLAIQLSDERSAHALTKAALDQAKAAAAPKSDGTAPEA